MLGFAKGCGSVGFVRVKSADDRQIAPTGNRRLWVLGTQMAMMGQIWPRREEAVGRFDSLAVGFRAQGPVNSVMRRSRAVLVAR